MICLRKSILLPVLFLSFSTFAESTIVCEDLINKTLKEMNLPELDEKEKYFFHTEDGTTYSYAGFVEHFNKKENQRNREAFEKKCKNLPSFSSEADNRNTMESLKPYQKDEDQLRADLAIARGRIEFCENKPKPESRCSDNLLAALKKSEQQLQENISEMMGHPDRQKLALALDKAIQNHKKQIEECNKMGSNLQKTGNRSVVICENKDGSSACKNYVSLKNLQELRRQSRYLQDEIEDLKRLIPDKNEQEKALAEHVKELANLNNRIVKAYSGKKPRISMEASTANAWTYLTNIQVDDSSKDQALTHIEIINHAGCKVSQAETQRCAINESNKVYSFGACAHDYKHEQNTQKHKKAFDYVKGLFGIE